MCLVIAAYYDPLRCCCTNGSVSRGSTDWNFGLSPQSDVSVCLTSGSIWTEGGGPGEGSGEGGTGICGVTDEAAEFSYDGRLESGCECLIDR